MWLGKPWTPKICWECYFWPITCQKPTCQTSECVPLFGKTCSGLGFSKFIAVSYRQFQITCNLLLWNRQVNSTKNILKWFIKRWKHNTTQQSAANLSQHVFLIKTSFKKSQTMKNVCVLLFTVWKFAKELNSLPASILQFNRSWQSWTCLRVTDMDEIGDRRMIQK